MPTYIISLLHKVNEQRKDKNAAHKHDPKAADNRWKNIYHASTIAVFNADNRKYQSQENGKNIYSRQNGTHIVTQRYMN